MGTDVERLQGRWNVVALEIDGNKLPEGIFGGARIMIDGNRFTTIAMGATYEGTFSVDSSKTPRTVDLNFSSGPEKGNTSRGIYELEGDTWKLCLTISNTERPAKFATSPDSGHALEILVRDEGKVATSEVEEAAAEGMVSDPAPEIEGEWTMVSGVRDGHPIDERMVKSGKRTAKGNETTVSFGGQMVLRANYAVNKSAVPHHIDYLHTSGMFTGQRQCGIYQLDGDLLRLSFASSGMARPEDFSARPGDGRTVTVWRRK